MLSLPTGSLKEFSRYIMRCLSKGYKTNAVVTKISLAKATNKGGIAYAKAVFRTERELTEAEIPLIAKMSEHIKEISQSVGFEEGGNTEVEKTVCASENVETLIHQTA